MNVYFTVGHKQMEITEQHVGTGIFLSKINILAYCCIAWFHCFKFFHFKLDCGVQMMLIITNKIKYRSQKLAAVFEVKVNSFCRVTWWSTLRHNSPLRLGVSQCSTTLD